jgi:hypothetical protein
VVSVAGLTGVAAAVVAGGVVASSYPALVWGLGLSEEDRAALRTLRLRGRDRQPSPLEQGSASDA